MVHRKELAQAEALVEREKVRQTKKAIALQQKLMKDIQGQFSRFTKIHRAHVEHMVLMCKELLTVDVHMYLKGFR